MKSVTSNVLSGVLLDHNLFIPPWNYTEGILVMVESLYHISSYCIETASKNACFNPMLSKLNYAIVKITQEMILYSSSDLCAIREGPHPLINMENYIPY